MQKKYIVKANMIIGARNKKYRKGDSITADCMFDGQFEAALKRGHVAEEPQKEAAPKKAAAKADNQTEI